MIVPQNNFYLRLVVGGVYHYSALQGKALMGTYDIDSIAIPLPHQDLTHHKMNIILKFEPFSGIYVEQQSQIDALPNDHRYYGIDGQIDISHKDFSMRFGWIPVYFSPFVIYGDPTRYQYRYTENGLSLLPEKTIERWQKGFQLNIKKFQETALFTFRDDDKIWVYGFHFPFSFSRVDIKAEYLQATEYFNDFSSSKRDLKIFHGYELIKILKNLKLSLDNSYSIFDKDIDDAQVPNQGFAYQAKIMYLYKSLKLSTGYNDINQFYITPYGLVKNLSFNNGWDYISIPFERSKYYYKYGILMNNRAGYQIEWNALLPPCWAATFHPLTISLGYEYDKEKNPTAFRGQTKIIYNFCQGKLSSHIPFLDGLLEYTGNYGTVERNDDGYTDFDDETIDLMTSSHIIGFNKQLTKLLALDLKWLLKETQRGKEENSQFIPPNDLILNPKMIHREFQGIGVTLSYQIFTGNIIFQYEKLNYKNFNNEDENYDGSYYRFYYSMSY